MAINYINLDDIENDDQISFAHKGVTYVMREISVSDLLKIQKKSAALEESAKNPDSAEDMEANLTFMVDQVCDQFPEFPRELCEALPLSKIQLIIKIMTSQFDDEEGEEVKKT